MNNNEQTKNYKTLHDKCPFSPVRKLTYVCHYFAQSYFKIHTPRFTCRRHHCCLTWPMSKKQVSYAYILPLVFNAEYNQFRQYCKSN